MDKDESVVLEVPQNPPHPHSLMPAGSGEVRASAPSPSSTGSDYPTIRSITVSGHTGDVPSPSASTVASPPLSEGSVNSLSRTPSPIRRIHSYATVRPSPIRGNRKGPKTAIDLRDALCQLGKTASLHDYLSSLHSPVYRDSRSIPIRVPDLSLCYVCGVGNKHMFKHMFHSDSHGALGWFFDLVNVDHPMHKNHLEGRPLVLMIHIAITQKYERPDEWTGAKLDAELRNFLSLYPSLKSVGAEWYHQRLHPLLVQRTREWAAAESKHWCLRQARTDTGPECVFSIRMDSRTLADRKAARISAHAEAVEERKAKDAARVAAGKHRPVNAATREEWGLPPKAILSL